MSIDDSELRNLYVDLRGAPARIQFGARKRLNQGRRLVEVEMREDAKGHPGNWFGKPGTSFPTGLERHVSSEMLTALSAEIGIESKGSGKLAHIIVYGSVNNDPVYDHTAALRRSEPAILRLFTDEAETDVLGGQK